MTRTHETTTCSQAWWVPQKKKKGGWGYDDFKKQACGYRANSCQHYEYLTVPSYWANAAF